MNRLFHTTQDGNESDSDTLNSLLTDGHYETPFSLPDPPPVPNEYAQLDSNAKAKPGSQTLPTTPSGYRSAIVFLTRAINYVGPNNDSFYLKRSHCYGKLGNFIAAREDA